MKIRKLLVAVVCLFILVGCGAGGSVDYPEFKVTIYYLDTCGHCQALKSNLVPKIEKEFGDKVTIELVSADDDEGQLSYGLITGYHDEKTGEFIEGKLDGFNEEYLDWYYVPFVVVDDKYAFLGYDENYDDYYIKDIKSALTGKELSSTMDVDRWKFKD